MISPLPGVTAGKPGSAMKSIPGIVVDVVTEEGESVPNGSGGFLVVKEPWPSMLRTLWGDDERFKDTYWSRFEKQGYYFAGDGAKKDDDGDIWLLGRVDDVMNVSGHRLSTTEIESALVSHPKVAEAAVVGAADETTGQAVCAFVILKESALEEGEEAPDSLIQELRQHVQKEIGAIAKPRQIMVVPELPKTRSGKIMRRLLKDVAENREVGDVTTLADSTVMDLIGKGMKSRARTTADGRASSKTCIRASVADSVPARVTLWAGSGGAALLVSGDQGLHQVAQGATRRRWSASWPSTTAACTEGTPRLCSRGTAPATRSTFSASSRAHWAPRGDGLTEMTATGLLSQRRGAARPGGPVDRVLEHAGHRAVVLRRRHDQPVRALDRLAEGDDRGRGLSRCRGPGRSAAGRRGRRTRMPRLPSGSSPAAEPVSCAVHESARRLPTSIRMFMRFLTSRSSFVTTSTFNNIGGHARFRGRRGPLSHLRRTVVARRTARSSPGSRPW